MRYVLILLPFLALCANSEQKSVCASCHQSESAAQPKTSMARALEPISDCEILRTHPDVVFRDNNYTYRIVRSGNVSTYTVTNGTDTITVPLKWAFGLGRAGQTYLYERNGSWYESRVSFFRAINALDLTLGARSTEPANLEEAAGRLMNAKDATDCFNCHSTHAISAQGQLEFTHLTPGIQCERCHGSAENHVVSFRSNRPSMGGLRRLGQLSSEDTSNFCGQCHRTWAQIASEGPFGINNIRFQPYRLTNSKCYDSADKRISCTACHNPHEDVLRKSSSYDSKCQACHAAGRHPTAKVCSVAKQDCAGCHMPKLELPGSHNLFTDHQIRIVKPNEKYPD